MLPLAETTSRQTQYSTWIEIRRDRLLGNLKVLKEQAGPFAEIMTVIKANAYGHGLLEVARALEGRVAYLGVSSLREAFTLKEHQIETPVFLFGRVLHLELPAAVAQTITLSVSSLEEAIEISEVSESLGRKTRLHIKVDTGMGRLGIPFESAPYEIEKIFALPGLLIEGIYTHFPTAERADGFTERQCHDFILMLEALEKKGMTFRYRHAANSAGSFKVKTPALNLVRPGLMLYGIYPSMTLAPLAQVSPILSLKTRIIHLKRLQPGESAGYGREFVASKPTTIAVLPIGYSHGYPFRLSHHAWVLHRGKRHKLAGRVSMDYIAVELGDDPAKTGDEITLLGEDGAETLRTEELAEWAGTIPYEIVTRLDPSLPRVCL